MPSLSIREKAVAVLVARLGTISTEDGYWHTVSAEAVERNNWDEDWPSTVPAVAINEVQETKELQNAQGQYECTLDLSVELVIAYAGRDIQTEKNKMVSDLVKAIGEQFEVSDASDPVRTETVEPRFVGSRDAETGDGSKLLVQLFLELFYRHSLVDDTMFWVVPT